MIRPVYYQRAQLILEHKNEDENAHVRVAEHSLIVFEFSLKQMRNHMQL